MILLDSLLGVKLFDFMVRIDRQQNVCNISLKTKPQISYFKKSCYGTDHFTVVCLVAWPLNESEAGVDLVLIETLLLSYPQSY